MGVIFAVYNDPINAERAIEDLKMVNLLDVSLFKNKFTLKDNDMAERVGKAIHYLMSPVSGWFPDYHAQQLKRKLTKNGVLISLRYDNLDLKQVARKILERTGAEVITSASELIKNRSA